MDEFVILHRPASESRECLNTGHAEPFVWKTCLRQIAFVTPATAEALRTSSDEIYSGHEAYAFLLEVICGLKSPVVGETEVFGQFKNFVASATQNSALSFQLRSFFQAQIQTAKTLRAQHLIGLGSQGYGSLVRKLAKADSAIAILGAGQLALEIIPWVIKEKSVQLVCRDVQRAQTLQQAHTSLQICSIDDTSFSAHACLVVAAPIADAELLAWLEQRPGQVRKILDLRAELQDASLFSSFQFISLKDVFGNIEKNKLELEEKLLQLKDLIQGKAQEHCERVLYRPFGWEDLCV